MPTTINPSDQTITQYNIQTGGASNLLNNVAPSATSGVPLISQGSSSQPVFGTVAIAGGGTNATSFTQSAGIVVYNGSSLVNYAGPQLTSGGIYTNTSQPVFNAFLSATQTNKTGNNTTYTIIFDSTQSNQGSNYATGTGIFTAPVTGNYLFTWIVGIQNILTATTVFTQLVTSASGSFYGSAINPVSVKDANSQLILTASVVVPMAATTTAKITIVANGQGADTIGVIGGTAAVSSFSGCLLC